MTQKLALTCANGYTGSTSEGPRIAAETPLLTETVGGPMNTDQRTKGDDDLSPRLPNHSLKAWKRALSPESIAALIPPAHTAWLDRAESGCRLVINDETGEFGHVYATRYTPPGWTLAATRGGAA